MACWSCYSCRKMNMLTHKVIRHFLHVRKNLVQRFEGKFHSKFTICKLVGPPKFRCAQDFSELIWRGKDVFAKTRDQVIFQLFLACRPKYTAYLLFEFFLFSLCLCSETESVMLLICHCDVDGDTDTDALRLFGCSDTAIL